MPFKLLVVATAAFLIGAPAHVHAQAQPQKKQVASPGFGTASKEPIQIDADRLEVFSKEQRAIYSGNVIAVQGDTTIKSAQMIVFYDRQSSPSGQSAAQPAAAEGEGGTALRRVEAKGGVTVISKDQVATGNEGVFDRSSNKIVLTGNVALSQGENVTKGEKLIYDTETGIAIVESGATAAGGRVRGVFVPGEDKGGVTAKPAAKPAPAPAADPRAKPKS
jgi:lipopolysaccharide export system protein LptA